jgi:hypothetical protein
MAVTELPDAYEEPDKLMDGWYLKWDVSTSFAASSISKGKHTPPSSISFPLPLSFCETKQK